jgi:hypothetical protein
MDVAHVLNVLKHAMGDVTFMLLFSPNSIFLPLEAMQAF